MRKILLEFSYFISYMICNRFKFVTSFSSLTLHVVNLLLWKKLLSLTLSKIITVSIPLTLTRAFLMGRSGCPTEGGNRGGSPWKSKILNFPLLLVSFSPKIEFTVPLLITDHILGKKVSLIAFRQILPDILPAACIFSYAIMTYLKDLDGSKSLNAKQCPAGLSPRIITQVSPFLPK